MFKVMLTVRNRLAITKKCISALYKHSITPFQLFVYDNQTSFKTDEHFGYFYKLYRKDLITKITFNTTDSTFNAFSKAVASNEFGYLHEMDPNKDKYNFLLFLDNDCIVTKGWDEIIIQAWKDVNNAGLKNIKIIAQSPGGIKNKKPLNRKIAGLDAKIGTLGGSGFWTVRPNFFQDVGFLDIKRLVGHAKKHDQEYWILLSKSAKGSEYILGLDKKLAIHCGGIAGSCCNVLTRTRQKQNSEELIKFEQQDDLISKMSFEEFIKYIVNNKKLIGDW